MLASCQPDAGTPLPEAIPDRGEPTGSNSAALPSAPEGDTPSTASHEATIAPGGATPTAASTEEPTAAKGGVTGPRIPCPAPDDTLKERFRSAVAGAAHATSRQSGAAMAEMLRLHLETLFAHDCAAALDAAQLTAESRRLVTDPPDALDIQRAGDDVLLAIYQSDDDTWLALYAWRSPQLQTLMVVTDDGSDMTHRMLFLRAAIFQPPTAPQPLMVLANTHPWHSSCWRSVRFRVFAPSAQVTQPRVLLDRKEGGRWCEGVDIVPQGDAVQLWRNDWLGSLQSLNGVWRGYALSYRYQRGALREQFGFHSEPHYVVEDWLLRPWSLARHATIPEARRQLARMHARLGARMKRAEHTRYREGVTDTPAFTHALLDDGQPAAKVVALSCRLSESGGPCPNWPRTVRFTLRRIDTRWHLAGIAETNATTPNAAEPSAAEPAPTAPTAEP